MSQLWLQGELDLIVGVLESFSDSPVGTTQIGDEGKFLGANGKKQKMNRRWTSK